MLHYYIIKANLLNQQVKMHNNALTDPSIGMVVNIFVFILALVTIGLCGLWVYIFFLKDEDKQNPLSVDLSYIELGKIEINNQLCLISIGISAFLYIFVASFSDLKNYIIFSIIPLIFSGVIYFLYDEIQELSYAQYIYIGSIVLIILLMFFGKGSAFSTDNISQNYMGNNNYFDTNQQLGAIQKNYISNLEEQSNSLNQVNTKLIQDTLVLQKENLDNYINKGKKEIEEFRKKEEEKLEELREKKLKDIEQKENQLNEMMQRDTEELNELEEDIFEAKDVLNELDDEIAYVQEDLNELDDEKAAIEEELDELDDEKAEVEEELDELDDEKAEVEEELDELDDEKKKLKKQIKKLAKTKNIYKNKLKNTKKRVIKKELLTKNQLKNQKKQKQINAKKKYIRKKKAYIQKILGNFMK